MTTVADLLARRKEVEHRIAEKRASVIGHFTGETPAWKPVSTVRLWDQATCLCCGDLLEPHPLGFFLEEKDASGARRLTRGRRDDLPLTDEYINSEVEFCTSCRGEEADTQEADTDDTTQEH